MEFEILTGLPDDALIAEGLSHLRAGRLEQAAQAFRRYTAQPQVDPIGHFLLGLAICQAGRPGDALAPLEQAVLAEPLRSTFWCMLGRSLHLLGRLPQAEACIQRAVALDPGHLDSIVALGALMLDLARFAEAERLLRSALSLRPGEPALLVRLALLYDRAGKPEGAAKAYSAILRADPRHPDACNNLGLLLMKEGRFDEACALFEQAIASRPEFAEAHYNLGLLHGSNGRSELAEHCYLRALALRPAYFDALNNLGNLYTRTGRWGLAEVRLRAAIALRPHDALGYSNLCSMLEQAGRRRDAIGLLRQVRNEHPALIQLRALLGNYLLQEKLLEDAREEWAALLVERPDFADAHMGMGVALLESGAMQEAEVSLRRAAELAPTQSTAWVNLACALRKLGRLADAANALCQAQTLNPTDPEIRDRLGTVYSEMGKHDQALAILSELCGNDPTSSPFANSLALALRRMRRHDEAIALLEEACRVRPEQTRLLCNLGTIYMDVARITEAIACFDLCLQLDPTLIAARWNRSHCLLLLGRFSDGWAAYETRLDPLAPKDMNCRQDALGLPMWNGEPLQGKRILVVGEQGFGDQLQFVRYIPLLAARAESVDLVVRSELVELANSVQGVRKVWAMGERGPVYDYYVMLMSLPYHLETTIESIPASVPYVAAGEPRLSRWRERILEIAGNKPRIGVVWSGHAIHPNDRYRSIEPTELASIGESGEIAWFSLHKRATDSAAPFACHDLGAEFHDFADTAAAVAHLDLVITVDTSVAHLAGAIGKPVWVMLAANPDWRWMLEREDTPWYPTMRLFRQRKLGDWGEVVARLRTELQAWYASMQPRKAA